MKNPNIPWNWHGLSKNPNLTLDILEKYGKCSWNWDFVSSCQFELEYERYSIIYEKLIKRINKELSCE